MFFFACIRAFLFFSRRGSALSPTRAVIFHLQEAGSGSGEKFEEGVMGYKTTWEAECWSAVKCNNLYEKSSLS